MDPESGISYDEPQPNTFSFNSPYGACERCDGLGSIYEIDESSVIPDPKLSIMKGGLAPVGEYREHEIFTEEEFVIILICDLDNALCNFKGRLDGAVKALSIFIRYVQPVYHHLVNCSCTVQQVERSELSGHFRWDY